jgi:hypothetical protein
MAGENKKGKEIYHNQFKFLLIAAAAEIVF